MQNDTMKQPLTKKQIEAFERIDSELKHVTDFGTGSRIVRTVVDELSSVKFIFPDDYIHEFEVESAESLEDFVRRIVREEIEKALTVKRVSNVYDGDIKPFDKDANNE